MTTSWSTQCFGQVVIDTYQKIKQQKPRLLTRAATAIIKIFTLSNKWRLEGSQYHYLGVHLLLIPVFQYLEGKDHNLGRYQSI